MSMRLVKKTGSQKCYKKKKQHTLFKNYHNSTKRPYQGSIGLLKLQEDFNCSSHPDTYLNTSSEVLKLCCYLISRFKAKLCEASNKTSMKLIISVVAFGIPNLFCYTSLS